MKRTDLIMNFKTKWTRLTSFIQPEKSLQQPNSWKFSRFKVKTTTLQTKMIIFLTTNLKIMCILTSHFLTEIKSTRTIWEISTLPINTQVTTKMVSLSLATSSERIVTRLMTNLWTIGSITIFPQTLLKVLQADVRTLELLPGWIKTHSIQMRRVHTSTRTRNQCLSSSLHVSRGIFLASSPGRRILMTIFTRKRIKVYMEDQELTQAHKA